MIRLLVGMCDVETETLAVPHEFSFFLLERQTFLKLFEQYLFTKCLILPNVSEFLEYHKYGRC